MRRLRLAHFSDPHIGPLPPIPPLSLLSKRAFGALNWWRNRGRALQANLLTALIADLKDHRPDHICLTGDLINIALKQEYANAHAFLATIGMPEEVSVIPGNHDAYVPGGRDRAMKAWAPYMAGDDGITRFPYVRRRGDVAIFGLSTAVATPPLSARGRVGAAQREALAMLLDRTDDAYKVVLIHHPPDQAISKVQRALADIEPVRRVLAEGCADLVLHGHNHRASLGTLATPTGTAHVIGAPSASSDGTKHPPAGYGLIDIDMDARSATLTRRTWSPADNAMVTTERAVPLP
ncbi:MAG: metallophosphoesterase [Pseudomonadota bacterium]